MKNFQQRSLEHQPGKSKVPPPSVTKYMIPVKKLITFRPDTPMSEVVNTLLKYKITGGPVLNGNGEVVGLIDDKDCLNIMIGGVYYDQPTGGSTVAAYMSNVMKSISIDANIMEVAHLFLTTPYKRLLVMDDDGKLAGQISRQDVLQAIRDMKLAG